MDKRIGAQLFTVRKYMKTIEDFDASCKKIADMGYKIVQVSGTKLPAKEMREILDKYGLKVVCSHRKFYEFMENLDEIIDYNKTLGAELCGIGGSPEEALEDSASLTKFIAEATRVGDVLRKEGLYFGYHNHAKEYGKIDGKLVMDRLIEETNPETFFFIFDTYWAQVGGKSPVDEIERMGNRLMLAHFKDFMVERYDSKKPLMTEIGNGNLNWNKIIPACEAAGVRWAVVEHDGHHMDDDPFKSLKASYDYLVTKGFC